jgi:GT2 family glycosyltransferase
MDITIALCTWNRAKLLSRTLQQLCELRVPDGLDWEVLVVDNNCTDETPAVVDSFADRLPIRRLVESAQGVSNARNCALRAARGNLLIFTDDDILVAEDWLSAYLSAAERWPSAGYFGGVIVPLYEREPPPWFRAHEQLLGPYIGEALDLGPDERVLTRQEWPWGGNMAFRRNAFQSVFFQPNLGRRGNDRTAGGEFAYCQSLADAGFQGVWIPSAKVSHLVGAERLTLPSVWRNFVGQGVTDVRIGRPPEGITLMLGVPRWLLLAVPKTRARYMWQRATGNPAWFKSFMDAAWARGALSEYWRQRRGPNA